LGDKFGTDLGERGPILDDIHRRRERSQRRGGEENRESDSHLSLDKPPEAERRGLGAEAKPSDGPEVHRRQYQDSAEKDHLGQDHHAVAGPDQGAEVPHIVEREPDARPENPRHGAKRHGRKPAEDQRGQRKIGIGSAEARERDQVSHPTEPDGGSQLVEPIEDHEQSAVLEPGCRMGEPGGVGGKEHCDSHDPPHRDRPRGWLGEVPRQGGQHGPEADPSERSQGEWSGQELPERPPSQGNDDYPLLEEGGDGDAQGPERDEPE
jgi:hypothetical protein